MSKDLKKILVTGASLLMMASVGSCIGNINVSARHRRPRITRRFKHHIHTMPHMNHHMSNKQYYNAGVKAGNNEYHRTVDEKPLTPDTLSSTSFRKSAFMSMMLPYYLVENNMNKYYLRGLFQAANNHHNNYEVEGTISGIKDDIKIAKKALRKLPKHPSNIMQHAIYDAFADDGPFNIYASTNPRNKVYKRTFIKMARVASGNTYKDAVQNYKLQLASYDGKIKP